MPELIPVTLDDAIAELERELKMREGVYPNLVKGGRLTQARADRQTERLAWALGFLHRAKG